MTREIKNQRKPQKPIFDKCFTMIIVFTKKGLMLDKIFKKSNTNDVFVFTDTQKTKSISNFYKNAKCFVTGKINNKNLNIFYILYLYH